MDPDPLPDDPSEQAEPWVNLALRRVILREDSEQQWIYLSEDPSPEHGPERGFPIVIGPQEAMEIQRVLQEEHQERPLTHQLTHGIIRGLGAKLIAVEISALKRNTFYARLVLEKPDGSQVRVDARPSDALAIGLRAGAQICAPEDLLEELRTDES